MMTRRRWIIERALAAVIVIGAVTCLCGVGLNEASRTIAEGYGQMFGGGVLCGTGLLALNWIRGGGSQ